MQTFLQSISGVLVIIGLIAVGYGLAAKGWFDEPASRLIARLVTQVSLPCYMLANITTKFTAHELLAMLPNLRYPVLSMIILMALAFAIAKAGLVAHHHSGAFISMFFNSNTVFVGLPINMALFGDKSVPYVLIYYMANTTFFWTLGTYLIQKDGQQAAHFDVRQTIRKVFSPPLLGFLIGMALVLAHIQLPGFLASDFNYLGNLTVPMSMLFIGIAVHKAGLRSLRLGRDNLLILFGRFVAAPLMMTLLVFSADVPHLMKQVFILQAAMPVMTNAPVVSKVYGADEQYAAVMVTETTLMSLFVVPILMVLVQMVH